MRIETWAQTDTDVDVTQVETNSEIQKAKGEPQTDRKGDNQTSKKRQKRTGSETTRKPKKSAWRWEENDTSQKHVANTTVYATRETRDQNLPA